ncbi:glyoxalase [Gramella sp. BOM4]|nr:glyoxalase [Christiangramia bathymodioli]
MEPAIDHIQITIKDLEKAEIFYDKLMPIFGFDLNMKSKGKVPEHEFEVIEYAHPNLIIGFNSPRSVFMDEIIHRRKPGAIHHLAFKAKNKGEVDQAYPKVRDIGAEIIETPRYYPEHGQNYYALFFKDPQGIKYEIVFEPRA